MPECPSCYRDLTYEDMMTHNGIVCRRLNRTVVLAAVAWRDGMRGSGAEAAVEVELFAAVDALRGDVP